MRITAGELLGRRVRAPDIPGLRPTPSKVRQALFNILGDIHEWQLLELFSGSGLMALESLSRHAAHVISIEHSFRLCQNMAGISRAWELGARWRIVHGDVEAILMQQLQEQHFDLVFADPPYDRGLAEMIPQWLSRCRIHCNQLIIEESSRARPEWPEGWTQTRSKRYGNSSLYFLSQTSSEEQ